MKITSAEFIAAAHKPGSYPPASLPEIAFAGRSNVGKSTLLNTLLNRKRLARTSRTPGRTQAVQFYEVNHRFFFVDLPGYGYARAPQAIRRSWPPLVEGYLSDRSVLRAVVMLLDARRTPTAGDVDLLNSLAQHNISVISVLTKSDKLSRSQLSDRVAALDRFLSEKFPNITDAPIPFSAVTGAGKKDLWRAIQDRLGR